MARNILANVLGGSWSAILTLLIIPVQIKILGVEAYGLLTFLASVQIICSVFDLGLTPTITREIATDTSLNRGNSRELVQVISSIYWGIGLLLATMLLIGSQWLATRWLHFDALPTASATAAIRLAALALMFRWPVSFYGGIIAGRQRFDLLNLIKAIVATFSLLGGIIVILLTRSLVVLTGWMALSALIEVTLYLVACSRLLPGLSLRPYFTVLVAKRIWQFAVSMNAINVLSIILTQSDRILLSRLLSMQMLGYYSLAYNVLLGLTLVQGFVTSAMFPIFATDHALGRSEDLVLRYRKATQGLVYVYALPISLLVFFGYDILRLWTTAEVAQSAAPILRILALGFLLNASVSLAYTLAIATGNTGIPLAVNFVSLLFYIPGLYLAIASHGALGAAFAWVVLNVSYLFSLLPLVQSRVVRQSVRAWVGRYLMPFVLCGAGAFGIGRVVMLTAGWQQSYAPWLVCTVAILLYCTVGFHFLDPTLRSDIRSALRRWDARQVITR